MSEVPPISFQLNRRTVVGNILTLFSGSAAAQAMGALALLLSARQIGPEQYGQYIGSTVLVTFASILFNLGLDVWLLRQGGREPGRIGEWGGSVLAAKTGLGAVWLTGMVVLAGTLATPSIPAHLIRLAAVLIWAGSLFTTTLTLFKSVLRNAINSILEAGSVAARLLGTLALIYLGARLAEQFMWMQTIILVIGLLAAFVIAARLFKLRVNWDTAINAVKESPPYAASDLLSQLFMRQDVLIVAFLLGDYAVGIYAPAVGILNAAFLLPAAVHLVMVPVLSNLFAAHPQQAWSTTRRSLVLQAAIGAALFVILFFGAPALTWLLGDRFAGAEHILQILSPIIFFQSINYGLSAVLVAVNLQQRRTYVQAIAVGVNLVLNLLVVRRFGIPGVAVVYVITEIVLVTGYGWLTWQFSGREKSRPTDPKSEFTSLG